MTYLITGGTGSFGHKFTERALKEKGVERIIIYSRDEYKMYKMKEEFPDPRMRFFVGDIRDYERSKRAFEARVDVVIHAAAMKQIPACEENPYEAIKTNIIGTWNICNAALDCGIKRVVYLSTDKATSPCNLYGVTKLSGEKIVIGANVYAQGRNQAFSAVRYGNVAGSRGSVIPLFQSLPEPLPITDYNMTRFWMTLDDAVNLVFKAIDIMVGGEVFIPKMKAFKITDLACALDKSAIEIGNRGGEKLAESMWAQSDRVYDAGDHYEIHPVGTEYFRKIMPTDPVNYSYASDKVELMTVDELRDAVKCLSK